MILSNFIYKKKSRLYQYYELNPKIKVINNKYSDRNIIMFPKIIIKRAEPPLCFLIFIPLVTRTIPPSKKINSNNKIGPFISSVCYNHDTINSL